MSRSYVEMLSDLKFQIAKRGGINSIGRCFRVNDSNKNGLFEFEEFELVFSRAGLFLKQQELRTLFRKFDRDNSGSVDYGEFLRALASPLGGRRLNVSLLAWQKFDKDGSGVVDLKDMKGTYDASKHPKVVTGEWTEEMVYKQFVTQFEGEAKGATKNDGKVTKDEFLDYMADLSSNFPFSDDKFVQSVENAWKVTEDLSKVNAVAPKILNKLKKEIVEKVRQRTKGAKFGKDTLAKAFRMFDFDDSGKLIYQEFKKGLEILGVQPTDNICQALFNSVDKSGNGAIVYKEFANSIFEADKSDFSLSFLNKMGDSKKKKPACIFVVGGPGTGKGTQCAKVAKDFGFTHLSTGDLLRAERTRKGSAVGKLINDIINEGKLVPSDITCGLLKTAMDASLENGGSRYFVIDGFPRNLENLDAWEKICSKSFNTATSIFFSCPEEEMVRRLLDRAKTSGRSDDNIETIKKRLRTFNAKTAAVLKVLRVMGDFDQIDCTPSPDKVYTTVKKVIERVIKKF